jgi:hypothetical protein
LPSLLVGLWLREARGSPTTWMPGSISRHSRSNRHPGGCRQLHPLIVRHATPASRFVSLHASGVTFPLSPPPNHFCIVNESRIGENVTASLVSRSRRRPESPPSLSITQMCVEIQTKTRQNQVVRFIRRESFIRFIAKMVWRGG